MSYTTLNGQAVSKLVLVVGWTGPWYCDVVVDDGAPRIDGRVSIAIGSSMALSGTVDANSNGVFGSTRTVRVIGGTDGWRRMVPAKDYANDAGVKAITVASDIAASVGETIGAFSPASAKLGPHYTRSSGLASTGLVDVIGSAQWWVDYDGVTQVGTRPESAPDPSSYSVVDYEPGNNRVQVSGDDLGAVTIGSIIAVGDGASLVARDIEVRVTGEERSVVAWCGPVSSGNRIARMLRSIARQADVERLWGVYPYRVSRMSGDRAELQVASQTAGLPDLLPIDQWHGVPGTHATLALGCEVLVGFIEGDRRRPYLQSYVGRGGAGHSPVALELGGVGGPAAARTGDSVRVTMPVGTFAGDIGGSPATGTVTWADPNAYGEVTGGSTVVRVA